MGGGPTVQAAPTPTAAPPPPDRTNTQVQNAATSQRQQYWGSQGGRTSSFLTPGVGADRTRSAVVQLLGDVGR